jgi:hypothetical protein
MTAVWNTELISEKFNVDRIEISSENLFQKRKISVTYLQLKQVSVTQIDFDPMTIYVGAQHAIP